MNVDSAVAKFKDEIARKLVRQSFTATAPIESKSTDNEY
jgi:hypothetical protein